MICLSLIVLVLTSPPGAAPPGDTAAPKSSCRTTPAASPFASAGAGA